VRRRAVALAALVGLAGLAACEHAQPFGAPVAEPNQPFAAAFPRRLTFGGGADVEPAWLPDGSGFIYSFPLGRADNDRCLGILPAEGGHQLRVICHVPVALDADSTNALFSPAVGRGGALAYVRESSVPQSLAPNSRELVVASLAAPDPGRVVLRLPYTAPDSTLQFSASHLQWAGATTLVFIADSVIYLTAGTFADTIITPIEVMRLDLAGASAALTVIPGTSHATSLVTDSVGAIYYTLPGDTRVYRLGAGGGAPAPYYDFGNAGVPSEVQVRGATLVAVIGGRLVGAHLGDSAVVAIPGPGSVTLFDPALAPSGARVVAASAGGGAPSNLWLLQVP
jgi:hypothetical protein